MDNQVFKQNSFNREKKLNDTIHHATFNNQRIQTFHSITHKSF